MPNKIMIRGRANSLGQLDTEFNHGPSPLHVRDVPIDLRARPIQHNIGANVTIGSDGMPVSEQQNLSQLIRDVHSIAGTLRLRRGLLGRIVTVTSVPQLIIEQHEEEGRGYLLLNPASVVGLTAEGTLLSTQTVVGAPTTITSGELGVANYRSGRFFIVCTISAGVGPVTFDLQSRDPVTDTYITSQTLASLAATGNVYVDVGSLGIDVDARMQVTVPAGTTATFSVGFVLKDGLEGTSAGATQTIFIGGGGVNPVSGYPILSGKERAFYFEENVLLYAVTSGPDLDMNIFEM